MTAAHKLSDIEIQMRVCAKRLRWPEAGTTIAWTKLHNCVDSLHRFVRTVDNSCAEVERNIDLSPGRIARRRTELGHQALTELANFGPFQIAEQAATKDIDFLEKRGDALEPEQAQMHQILTKALADLRDGVAATERAVIERCQMRADTLAGL